MSKLVFITGWATWIWKSTVEKFASEWFNVFFNYLSNKTWADELISKYDNVSCFQGDMSSQGDIENTFNKIFEVYSRYPDVLVNNAAIVSRIKFPDANWDDFENILKINTVWPYRVTREFFIRLNWSLEGKSVVFIWSLRWWPETATTIDYSASKAAIHNMTASLSKVMSPCRVNWIAPWFTKTPMHEWNYQRLDVEAQKSVLKRYSESSDIADAVYFLASNNSKSITWQVIRVDNGRWLMT